MCPVCGRLTTTQNVKTPTKEQVKLIIKNAFHNCMSDVATTDFIKCCIIEWEKIRGRTNADN